MLYLTVLPVDERFADLKGKRKLFDFFTSVNIILFVIKTSFYQNKC